MALVVVIAGAAACKPKDRALAKLVKADGPVERQAGTGPWAGAKLGAAYFLGDAARTADGGAQLEVVGGALIAMQPHTILRFGGTPQAGKLAVELGAIELTGTGRYGFDIGDVRLSRNGTVRITATSGGASKVELTIGEAQVSTLGGETIDLEVGTPIDIGLDVAVTPILPDAGAPIVDAAVAIADAGAPDAGAIDEGAAIDVAGTKVEVQLAGATAWTRLAAGAGNVPAGAKLRLAAGSTAKLVSLGTTLDLAGGARIAIADDLSFILEAGEARASATSASTVRLPGGSLALAGSPEAPAEARLASGRDTKVTMQRGSAKLVGNAGSELDMSRGESATLAKGGTIRVLEAIPKHVDFRMTAGESLTIHDPRPPTAVQFRFGGTCPRGGIIEMDRDARFRTAKTSSGSEAANLMVAPGRWAYRLRCTTGAGEGGAVASGRVVVLRDDGRRALPKIPPVNAIDADGRTWRISYQSQIPNLRVNVRGAGSAFKLHLAQGGRAQTFAATTGSVVVPGSKLAEGEYTYWFDVDGKKQAKVSTLKIDFDQTAPQVYIESPPNAKPWTGDLDVRGAVLPGWTAAVDGVPVPIDKARRFAAKVQPPSIGALAIRLSHPQRGVHYYLRRNK